MESAVTQIDPGFIVTYNANPMCMTTVGVIADWYRERGDDEAAEFFDRVRKLGLYPTTRPWCVPGSWGFFGGDCHTEVPSKLWPYMDDDGDRSSPWGQMERMLRAWRTMEPWQRDAVE